MLCLGDAGCGTSVTTAMLIDDEVTCISLTSELHSTDPSPTESTNDEALPDSSNVESSDNVVLGLGENVHDHANVASSSDPCDSGISTVCTSELGATQAVDGVIDSTLRESMLRESIVCTLHRFVLPLTAVII